MREPVGLAYRPGRELITLAAVSAADCAILFAAWTGAVLPGAAVAAHGGLALGLLVIGFQTFRRDYTFLWLSLVAVVVAGPIGSAGVALVLCCLWTGRLPGADVDAWYDRLSGSRDVSPSVELYDSILQDRSFRPGRHPIDHFPGLLDGALPRQQALLGLIGLDFHPEYASLLKDALRSAEPSIRTHAAAVSVKLRSKFADLAKSGLEMIAREADAASLQDAIRRIQIAARSGFLDEQEASRILEKALACCREKLAQSGSADAEALEIQLLAELGRWTELAKLRRTLEATAEPHRTTPAVVRSLMETAETSELNRVLRSRQATGAMRGAGYAT